MARKRDFIMSFSLNGLTQRFSTAFSNLTSGDIAGARTALFNNSFFNAGANNTPTLSQADTAMSHVIARLHQTQQTSALDATPKLRMAYVTRGNELLIDIARKYHVPVNDLIKANPHIRGVYTPPSGSVVFVPLEKATSPLSNDDRARLIRWQSDTAPVKQTKTVTAKPEQLPAAQVEPVTVEQMLKIRPALGNRATQVTSDLNQAMRDARITTRTGQAMFLAQMLHEMGTRGDLNEIGGDSTVTYNGKKYNYFFYMYDKESPDPGRRDVAKVLGNTEPGDGIKFHGRGYVQLTGRSNYEHAGNYLGIDLINNPDLAAESSTAVRTAAWFWRYGNGNLNALATKDANFNAVTKRINGKLTGIEDRMALYKLAKEALGVK